MSAHGDDRVFTAREVQETAGLTYRQLNDWEARGALPPDRDRGTGWRRFSPRDVFVLMVCAELRQRFGVPVERLTFVHRCMLAQDADHLSEAVDLMALLGVGIWLVTDLNETFVMDSELEIRDLIESGFLSVEGEAGYILLKVNPLVNKILTRLKEPEILPEHGRGYEILRLLRNKFGIRSAEEFEVLEAIRSGDYVSVEVVLASGKVKTIRTTMRPDVSARLEDLLREHQYQKVTVTQKDGRVVAVEQETTRKVNHDVKR